MRKFCIKIKYISEYIFFIIFVSCLKLLGLERSAQFCSYIARKIGPYLRVTKIAKRNLKSVYGNQINIEKTIDNLWDNFGKYIGELPFIQSISQEEIDKRVKIEGLGKIAHLKNNKQPFLLFLGHQANWDFVIRTINKLSPKFGIVYRKANNPYVDRAILKIRKNDNINLIAKGISGVKGLIKSIKSGHSIAMLVDQKMNDGIEVPFFGRLAMTANAIAKLALQYNYPIVGAQIIRTNGSNFKVIISDPLKIIKTGDMQTDLYNIMLNINQLLEQWIREYPHQWFWFHNRWKD